VAALSTRKQLSFLVMAYIRTQDAISITPPDPVVAGVIHLSDASADTPDRTGDSPNLQNDVGGTANDLPDNERKAPP
jgi:hypothetical protein